MEGRSECPTEVEYAGRKFLVFGHLVRTGSRSGGFLATMYWVDVTEFCRVRDQFQATRPVAAVLESGSAPASGRRHSALMVARFRSIIL